MRKTLFTIGYEGLTPERLHAALKAADVSLLADVRAVANSRKRGFSKGALKAGLVEAGLGYEHFRSLGTPKSGRMAARELAVILTLDARDTASTLEFLDVLDTASTLDTLEALDTATTLDVFDARATRSVFALLRLAAAPLLWVFWIWHNCYKIMCN